MTNLSLVEKILDILVPMCMGATAIMAFNDGIDVPIIITWIFGVFFLFQHWHTR
jgi:hypothetical protein